MAPLSRWQLAREHPQFNCHYRCEDANFELLPSYLHTRRLLGKETPGRGLGPDSIGGELLKPAHSPCPHENGHANQPSTSTAMEGRARVVFFPDSMENFVRLCECGFVDEEATDRQVLVFFETIFESCGGALAGSSLVCGQRWRIKV